MKGLKGELKEEQLVLSIVAGAKIDTIRRGLGHDKVVRVMPNTPAQVGEGMSVWTSTAAVSQKQKDTVQTILRAMGKEIYFSDEKYSGSGPAYIFLIMEALIDAAVHIGLPRELAGELVAQTVMGSAHMTRESGKHPAELKNRVTSPGGTTAEGLLCLEEGGVRAIMAQAVIAAYEKAKLLGGESAK
jgi:pyrroline-5-carboxylate reductase